MEYGYLTELQSHLREFDCLKSTDIEEKINSIIWLDVVSPSLFLFSTNDKTIKLWKLSDKVIKKSSKTNKKVENNSDIVMPRLREMESGYVPILKRAFSPLHEYNINSLAVLANKDNLVSSDDLRINLWDYQNTASNAFMIYDLKPNQMEEISEIITSTKAHPTNDSIISFSTSKGNVKLIDMRKKAINDDVALSFEDKKNNVKKNFFSEIINSVSDLSFANGGNYIVSRDYLNAKVWDLRKTDEPSILVPLYDPIKTKLCELYENETIFDKFSINCSPCGNYFLTGSYNSKFHIYDIKGGKNMMYETNYKKKTIIKEIPANCNDKIGSTYEFDRKILKSTWCETDNTIIAASLNCLFIYGC